MASSQVTIGAAIRYAWTLLRANFRAIWGVLALSALASTVWAAGDLTRNLGLQGSGALFALVTMLMVYGAIFRAAFADRHADDPAYKTGSQGIQWGAVEWRMVGASALVAFFIILIGLLVIIALGAVLVGLLMARGATPTPSMTPDQVLALLGPYKDVATVGATVVLVIVLVYLSMRLALATPASADEKGVRVLQTWKHTRGHVWPMLAAILFVQLPLFIISAWIAVNVTNGDGLPSAVGPGTYLVAAIALGAPAGLFVNPMVAGVYAYFYRALALQAPPPAPRP